VARDGLLAMFAITPNYLDSWERFRDIYRSPDIWRTSGNARWPGHGEQPIALEHRAELLIALEQGHPCRFAPGHRCFPRLRHGDDLSAPLPKQASSPATRVPVRLARFGAGPRGGRSDRCALGRSVADRVTRTKWRHAATPGRRAAGILSSGSGPA